MLTNTLSPTTRAIWVLTPFSPGAVEGLFIGREAGNSLQNIATTIVSKEGVAAGGAEVVFVEGVAAGGAEVVFVEDAEISSSDNPDMDSPPTQGSPLFSLLALDFVHKFAGRCWSEPEPPIPVWAEEQLCSRLTRCSMCRRYCMWVGLCTDCSLKPGVGAVEAACSGGAIFSTWLNSLGAPELTALPFSTAACRSIHSAAW